MKKHHFAASILAIAMTAACNTDSAKKTTGEQSSPPVATNEEMVKRGKYLVSIMGCNDCHSPKVMTPQGLALDTTRLLSGHPSDLPTGPVDTTVLKSWVLFGPMLTAAAGPWGVSYSANLTSDDSGIGSWTEAQFMKAIKEGKYKGMDNGRMLLPPMPWQEISNATDEDLKAIFAFLKSTKPVRNVVPPPVPPIRG